jgi:predicted GIY-YIG superfamily endonuclease
MLYVYFIQCEAGPNRRYVGYTNDLKQRIKTHYADGSIHTAKYQPLKLVGYHAFSEKKKVQDFERYMKSTSGRAFASKRLW